MRRHSHASAQIVTGAALIAVAETNIKFLLLVELLKKL